MMKKAKDNTKSKSVQSENTSKIKEITPKRSKRGRHILLYLAIIGFTFYAVITIINQSVQIADKRAKLNDLNQQINVVEIQTGYLKKVQGYKGDDLKAYMEKIAKEELGYISEGERIFINVAGE